MRANFPVIFRPWSWSCSQGRTRPRQIRTSVGVQKEDGNGQLQFHSFWWTWNVQKPINCRPNQSTDDCHVNRKSMDSPWKRCLWYNFLVVYKTSSHTLSFAQTLSVSKYSPERNSLVPSAFFTSCLQRWNTYRSLVWRQFSTLLSLNILSQIVTFEFIFSNFFLSPIVPLTDFTFLFSKLNIWELHLDKPISLSFRKNSYFVIEQVVPSIRKSHISRLELRLG